MLPLPANFFRLGDYMLKSTTSSTKDRIIDVSIDLFSENGYTETSIRSIAVGVGIKVSSIYSHFSSKQEILDDIFDEYVGWFHSATPDDEDIEAFIEEHRGKYLDEIILNDFWFITFPAGLAARYNKIIKIIYYEAMNNDKLSSYLEYDAIEYSLTRHKEFLNMLVEEGMIKCRDTSTISCLLYSVASAYMSLAAMSVSTMDRFGGNNSMRKILDYVMKQALEVLDEGDDNNELRQIREYEG